MSQVPIPRGTLIVVGDGSRVLFFRNVGTAFKPKLAVENVFEQENPPTREQGTDKPGVSTVRPGTVPRFSVEQTDWHQIAEDRFASEIADTLYRLVHEGRADKLVIVAPPKALGVLRKNLHKEVEARLRAVIDKDWTPHTPQEIEELLAF
jgi:protein required for attachment to host cells